ncbi:MAG: hypothetical protein OMM_14047, partial [Candidatus Magnetoglobus multicellularis str. Araruama]
AQGNETIAFELIDQKALDLIQIIPDNYFKSIYLLALNLNCLKIYQKYPIHELKNNAGEILLFAEKTISGKTANLALKSYIQGYKGLWAAVEDNFSQAMKCFQKAIFLSNQGGHPEITYQWQWQLARVYQQQNNSQMSIQSYQNAIQSLKLFQHDFFIGYRSQHLLFQNMIKPVFRELVALYLVQTEKADKNEKETFLFSALETMEALKKGELENYFEDECITVEETELLTRTTSGTALIYPIFSGNDLSVILIMPDYIKYQRLNVEQERLKKSVKAFRKELWQLKNNFMDSVYYPQQIYQAIISPIENELTLKKIETLIVVPDEELRLIPFSCLYDGSQFLIERYAIITV